MKNIILTMMIVNVFGFGAHSQSKDQSKELKGIVKVEIDGLSCPFCAYGLEKKLNKMDGVVKIEIDVENAFALLTLEDGKTLSETSIREKVKDAGFTAREIKEVTKERK